MRARFPGSEPYDADEYATSALMRDGDDGGAGTGGGGEEEDAPQQVAQPPPPLSIEDELKLRLCELKANGDAGRGLSEADMNNILRIVKLAGRANHEELSDLFANCDQLTGHLLELVAQHPQLMWYVADVRSGSFPDAPPAKVIYRRLEDMLASMVRTLDIKWGFWGYETTQGGERIYAHPCGAELFETVCKLLEGTDFWALTLQLWSDKANLTKRGNKTYYPLSCVVLSVLFDQFREQWPDSAIAFLPVIDRSDVPVAMTDCEFRLYKAEIEAASLERVLLPVLDAAHGFRCLDSNGTARNVVAVLHSWVADFMEQLTLAGLIGQTGCALCAAAGDALLPTPDGDAATAAPRSASAMAAGLSHMRAAFTAGRTAEFDRLRSKYRMQGTPSILLTLFQRGWLGRVAASNDQLRSLVPASAMPFDTLHVFDEGATKRVINMIAKHLDRKYGKATGSWLTDTLAMRVEVTLDMAFIEETKWPNPYKVFRGKAKEQEGCGGLQACEMRAVCQLLPVISRGILGEKTESGWRACAPNDDYVTDVVCAYVTYYMELKRYNRPPGHTARTLELLEHLGARFLRILREHFLEDQTSGFALPKTHQGFSEHVPATIRLLGATHWLTTEWGENSVKSGHAAYEATNKNTGTAEEQMAVHMAKRAAARISMAMAGLSVAPTGLGTRRTARRVAQSTGVNTLAVESVCRFTLEKFSADPLPPPLEGRPGMASFVGELNRFLVAEQKPTNVPWVSIVNSAALNARMPHHPDAYAGTALHTVYATPSFKRRRRMSFVAIEGGGADGALEEWIGQLLLLFSLPDGTPLAYVQFLVQDATCAGQGPLFGMPNCAPLVWERVGPHSRYSYAVTHLDKLIRREFVVPDLSGVFAPRRLRQRREGARARRAARRWADSDNSSSSSNSDGSDGAADSSSEDHEADVAHAEDGPAKRWPRWIRNPFIWGWG